MVIDVEDIIGQEVVRDINVLPAVVVDITDGSGVAVAFEADACLVGDVVEYGVAQYTIPVISEESSPAGRGIPVMPVEEGSGGIAVEGFVDCDVDIKITVVIEIGRASCRERVSVWG